jgi:hypothetical protein
MSGARAASLAVLGLTKGLQKVSAKTAVSTLIPSDDLA